MNATTGVPSNAVLESQPLDEFWDAATSAYSESLEAEIESCSQINAMQPG
jgi:hypothetical protein